MARPFDALETLGLIVNLRLEINARYVAPRGDKNEPSNLPGGPVVTPMVQKIIRPFWDVRRPNGLIAFARCDLDLVTCPAFSEDVNSTLSLPINPIELDAFDGRLAAKQLR